MANEHPGTASAISRTKVRLYIDDIAVRPHDLGQFVAGLGQSYNVTTGNPSDMEQDLARCCREDAPDFVVISPSTRAPVEVSYSKAREVVSEHRRRTKIVALSPDKQPILDVLDYPTDEYMILPQQDLIQTLGHLIGRMRTAPLLRRFPYLLVFDRRGDTPKNSITIGGKEFKVEYTADPVEATEMARGYIPQMALLNLDLIKDCSFSAVALDLLTKIHEQNIVRTGAEIPILLYSSLKNSWDNINTVLALTYSPAVFRLFRSEAGFEGNFAEDISGIIGHGDYNLLSYLGRRRESLLSSLALKTYVGPDVINGLCASPDLFRRICGLGERILVSKNPRDRWLQLAVEDLVYASTNGDPKISATAADTLAYSLSQLPVQAADDARAHLLYTLSELQPSAKRMRGEVDSLLDDFVRQIQLTKMWERPAVHRTRTIVVPRPGKNAYIKAASNEEIARYRRNIKYFMRFSRMRKDMLRRGNPPLTIEPFIGYVAAYRLSSLGDSRVGGEGLLLELERNTSRALYPYILNDPNIPPEEKKSILEEGFRQSACIAAIGPLNPTFYEETGDLATFLSAKMETKIKPVLLRFLGLLGYDMQPALDSISVIALAYNQLNERLVQSVADTPLVYASDRHPGNTAYDTVSKRCYEFDFVTVRKLPIIYDMASWWQLKKIDYSEEPYDYLIERIVNYFETYNLATTWSFNPASEVYRKDRRAFIADEMRRDLEELRFYTAGVTTPDQARHRIFCDVEGALKSLGYTSNYPSEKEIEVEAGHFSSLSAGITNEAVIKSLNDRIGFYKSQNKGHMVEYLEDLRDYITEFDTPRKPLFSLIETGEALRRDANLLTTEFFNALRVKTLSSACTYLDYYTKSAQGEFRLPVPEAIVCLDTIKNQMDIGADATQYYARMTNDAQIIQLAQNYRIALMKLKDVVQGAMPK